jgi:hypothetical protein
MESTGRRTKRIFDSGKFSPFTGNLGLVLYERRVVSAEPEMLPQDASETNLVHKASRDGSSCDERIFFRNGYCERHG